MAAGSFTQTSFLGGEWSKAMQGRFDRPDYRAAMNVCLNGYPTEQGSWVRRPGTIHSGTTRGAAPGRVISFDFKQASPYTMELTAGYLRFRAGTVLVEQNDAQDVVGISTANPAVVQVAAAWATGTSVIFHGLGSSTPLLQNRVFTITNIDGTHFSLQDAITGDNIDGSTLGTFAPCTVARIYELTTVYTGALWQTLRSIQADIPTTNSTTPGAVFLHSHFKPYILKVETPPTDTAFATFSLEAAVFKDGPYFDPVPGGALATPSALQGNISITLSFPAYDSTHSYSVGDYVTSASVNYKSLQDANLNHTPAGSPTYWEAVSGSDPIGPNGFQASDIGRHIRLFSEPALWASGTTYAKDAVVAYGGTGTQAIGAVYWISLVGSNTGNIPGADLTKWALYVNGAKWTWGRITGLSNIIDRALAGSTSIGDMTSGGGLAAAFDGNFSQAASASAEKTASTFSVPSTLSLTSYVGKNYSAASDQVIAQATVYPSTDHGLAYATISSHGIITPLAVTSTFNLRGKASAPASASDGTLLGTSGPITVLGAAVTIVSSDQTTAWKYVWVEQITTTSFATSGTYFIANIACELSFFGPPGTGTSAGVTVQIVGDALLYTTPIRTWRLGLYSDTTGWPTCGTYHEGRLWLSGTIANRIDSSKSNDIFNFAPTNSDGSVSADNGISYTFAAPDINPIFWMVPDYNGIVCGTQAGEWIVMATNANLPLTPTTIQAHRTTTNQCANIEPRRADLTLAVVQSFRRELLEYFADVYSGKFTAADLTETAKHLTKGNIAEIAYQQELTSIIWARLDDGNLIGCTYKRRSLVSSQPSEMRGWHRHTLGSSRTLESICAAATNDGNLPTLALVTTDTDGIRHVEILSKMIEETDDLGDLWLLDDAVRPSSATTSELAIDGAPYGGMTLNGLWHLNDQTVSVFAAGLDCGDFAVTDGSIFVPFGDGVSAGTGSGLFTLAFAAAANDAAQIVVGFTYTSDGQIVRPMLPAESGARNGPALGKTRRVQMASVLVTNSAGMSIGTDFAKLYPMQFKAASQQNLQPLDVANGVYWDSIRDDNSFDGMLCWRVNRPLPAIVAAVEAFLHTQDR